MPDIWKQKKLTFSEKALLMFSVAVGCFKAERPHRTEIVCALMQVYKLLSHKLTRLRGARNYKNSLFSNIKTNK